ncbi:MAG: hypothetical protein ACK4VW_02550, partial [Anaerolineales bacterium]
MENVEKVPSHGQDEELILALRSVLFEQDIHRLETLERRLEELRIKTQTRDQELNAQVTDL